MALPNFSRCVASSAGRFPQSHGARAPVQNAGSISPWRQISPASGRQDVHRPSAGFRHGSARRDFTYRPPHSVSFRAHQVATASQQPSDFVNFFRSAAPFIEGHRGKTFVVAIPSVAIENERVFTGMLEDILVLIGLGVRIVLVYGCTTIVTRTLEERGLDAQFVGGYRVTDGATMNVAMEIAGTIQLMIDSRLSQGPSISVVRKHTRDSSQFHFAPPFSVISGNFTSAKRRGVVNGVDFGRTGQVRFVQADAIKTQLDAGNIVVMSNIGFSAIGEVLNCNMHDVASHAAIELGADKLICVSSTEDYRERLGEWLALPDAERMVLQYARDAFKLQDATSQPTAGSEAAVAGGQTVGQAVADATSAIKKQAQDPQVLQSWSWDLDTWRETGVDMELVACVAACRNGVKRAHLVDGNVDGAILLELYSRDGVGTMVSTDFYEGIRPATAVDIEGIKRLLKPLVAQGIVIERTDSQLLEQLPSFTVVERESKIIACVLLKDVGLNSSGQKVAEVAAFCVDPAYRNGGRGDSLLDYVEQKARAASFDLLVILTTRTADWFCCRGFIPEGIAYECPALPDTRRAKIDRSRKSECYSKELAPIPLNGIAPAGKRIGF